jgi:hypothetical protein
MTGTPNAYLEKITAVTGWSLIEMLTTDLHPLIMSLTTILSVTILCNKELFPLTVVKSSPFSISSGLEIVNDALLSPESSFEV